MAALRARRRGARATLVSKESSPVGGATVTAAGVIQALLNPADDPDTFFNDVMRGGAYLNDPALVRILVERSALALERLQEYGVVLDPGCLDPAHLGRGEGHSVARGYYDRREMLGICVDLGRALASAGVDFHPETAVFRLFTSRGRITGALAFHLPSGGLVLFQAPAVVLATGGLGGLYELSTNPRTLTGDGYALAWQAGAAVRDMEMIQFLPLAFPYPEARRGHNIGVCALFGPRVRLLNAMGERFMERYDPERLELSTRDVVARAIFNEVREGRGTPGGAVHLDPRDHDPAVRERFRVYHPHVHRMLGEVFGERAARWEEPFEVIPSQHFCMGGVEIDRHCCTAVPGLFAAGEVAGGVHGANRLVGDALTEAFVFGDLAGESAAAWAHERPGPEVDRAQVREAVEEVDELWRASGAGSAAPRPCAVKQMLRRTMWHHFGPMRDGWTMREGLNRLHALQRDTRAAPAPAGAGAPASAPVYHRERLDTLEASLMLRTALLVAESALAREESRGAHYRLDYPHTDERLGRTSIVLRRDRGEITDGGGSR